MRKPEVLFRPFRLADANALLSWASSPDELLQWAGPHFSFPLDAAQLRRHAASAGRHRHLLSAIGPGGEVVGHAELNLLALHDLGQLRRVAVAPEARGKGIGRALVERMTRLAFDDLRLNRLELVVSSFNERARRCYESAGFVQEGQAREARKASDGYWHLVYMALLRSRYLERHRAGKTATPDVVTRLEPMAQFAANLRFHRRRTRLSQTALGARASLHRTAIGLLERGERVPRLDTVVVLASALSIPAAALLAGVDGSTLDVAALDQRTENAHSKKPAFRSPFTRRLKTASSLPVEAGPR